MVAKRSCRSAGFFRDRQLLSSADFYAQNHKSQKRTCTVDNGQLFNVERVITSRRSKDKNVRILSSSGCCHVYGPPQLGRFVYVTADSERFYCMF